MHNGRKFVLGDLGQRYRVRVFNPTPARLEAVVSVDGLDSIDGRRASLSKRGYIVPAFGSVTIDGFRTSMETVAAFRFSSVSDSFAAETGQARNVGVIGVALFREQAEPIEIAPDWRRKRSADAPGAAPRGEAAPSPGRSAGAMKQQRDRSGLGTEFGEQRESHVRETVFVRESESPSSMLELRYNDRDGLRALGIPLPASPDDDEVDMRETADPFPGDRRFAQPPPGR